MTPNSSAAQEKPDILVLGDSQLSFGAGEKYLKFFEDLPQRCMPNKRQRRHLKKLGDRKTAAIGVRSTSLGSWTAQSGAAKGSICNVDKKYGVNAGAYGIASNPKRVFVQIGKGRSYQFCKPKTSAFKALFSKGYYDPKLIVLTFLGNAAQSWAESPEIAQTVADRTAAQIPRDVPCVFLTTVPVYSKRTNDLRQKAQANIKAAFENSGTHCQFVEGFSPQTRQAIEGKPKFFAKHKDGRIKDPLHPSKAAVDIFLKLNEPQLCSAIFTALK